MASSLPVSLHQGLVNCRKPKYWDDINYNDVHAAEKRVFALIDIKPESKEYEETEQLFQTSPGSNEFIITKIERIQHPFAYGSFLINAVYKSATSSEEKVIYPFTNDLVKLHLFIEKNLDERILRYYPPQLDTCTRYAIIKEEMNVKEDSSGAVRYPKYLLHLTKKPAKTVSTEIGDVADVTNVLKIDRI